MIYVFTAVAGLCIGSFFNVLIARLDRKGGIIAGRSECPKCGHRLFWYDLIPLVSYFLLRAKCRYCQSVIALRYPLVEFLTAVILLLFVSKTYPAVTWEYFFAMAGLLLLLALALFDFFHYILPDKLVFALAGLGLARVVVIVPQGFVANLLSGLLVSGIFAILYVVSSGRWMGFGDVKLLLAIGLFFGYPITIVVTLVSVWLAALVGILLIIVGRASLKTALPFGTFLAAASMAAITFQHELAIATIFFP